MSHPLHGDLASGDPSAPLVPSPPPPPPSPDPLAPPAAIDVGVNGVALLNNIHWCVRGTGSTTLVGGSAAPTRGHPYLAVYSKVNIAAGSELFGRYGPLYWAHYRHLARKRTIDRSASR
jgi:hypothetical protein